jgi:uncharacterized membrane protein HdeD (DUF308 family)
LLVGKREFVIGQKAIFAGISRIVIGLVLLCAPLSGAYNVLYFLKIS